MFSRQPTSVPSSNPITEFTEKQLGSYFWVKYKGGQVKLKLVKLTAERGWFKQQENRLSIHCSKVTSLTAPNGPTLTGLSSEQIGQFFWVQHEQKVQLQLVGLNARRGWFELKHGIISIHCSKVIPYGENEEIMEEDVNDEAISEDDELAAFTQAQEEKHVIITVALKKAVEKLQKAILGIGSRENHPDTAFSKPLQELYMYMQLKVQALADEEGPFRCLPNSDGPQGEVASAQGHLICLYKPFFAEGVTSSEQADYLIHESVHSCLKVPDYAYLWQYIFRFLPLEFRLKNPDSYVALVRTFSKEAIKTPNSGDNRNDYTLGMIQHICYRGSTLLKQCEAQWDLLNAEIVPEPLQSLKALYPQAQEEQIKGLVTLGQLAIFQQIAFIISSEKLQLLFDKLLPSKVDDAQGKMENGVITVQYIEATTVTPYMAVLVKILMIFQVEKGKAIAVAKALDALTDRCLIPRIKDPSSL
jgi:hypothetical protein